MPYRILFSLHLVSSFVREYWNQITNINNNNISLKGDKDTAGIQDLVLSFCPNIHCVPQRKLKLNACIAIILLL